MTIILRKLSPAKSLFLLGIVYGVIQLLLVDMSRYFNWDEAVYYSQVAPNTIPVKWAASRSHGISWLIAPLTYLAVGLQTIRYFLLLFSSFLMVFSYRVWIPILRGKAVLAGSIFVFSWLTIFYGSEISPNLPVAFLSVAAIGYASRPFVSLSSMPFHTGMIFAIVAILRPTDSIWLAIGFGITVLLVDQQHMIRRLLPVAVGIGTGWIPWLIEAYVRFGGVMSRLKEASEMAEGTGGLDVLLWHMSVVDGPTWERVRGGDIPVDGMAWWVVLFSLASVALFYLGKKQCITPIMASTISALVFLLAYVFMAGVARPRYLQPFYSLLSIPVAVGLEATIKYCIHNQLRFIKTLVYSVIILLLHWHINVLKTETKRQNNIRTGDRKVGYRLKHIAHKEPCSFVSEWGMPSISVRSGCRGLDLYGLSEKKALKFLNQRACTKDFVFAIASQNYFKKPPIIWWKKTWIASGLMLYRPYPNGLRYCNKYSKLKNKWKVE